MENIERELSINIQDVKGISGVGGHYNYTTETSTEYFTVTLNSDEERYFSFTRKLDDKTARKCKDARRELKKLYNDYNKVPEMYYLYTKVFGRINGSIVHVGYEVENNLDEYEIFSLLEIDELRKQFKIGDRGFRSLVYMQAFQIDGNEIINKIDKKWIDQLKDMGYNTDILQYELKEG